MDKKITGRQGCRLCPRNCGTKVSSSGIGMCGVPGNLMVARAALHFWEEPCISGTRGSGAVFFSGCSMHCVYCQNGNISGNLINEPEIASDGTVKGIAGKVITGERLSEIFWELREKGANNINLVTPDQYLPDVAWAVRKVRDEGFDLPFLMNCSGYEKVEVLKIMEGLIDIYLPDFKYMDPELAERYSNASDYPEVAKAAIAEMVRQCPVQEFSPEEKFVKKEVDISGETVENRNSCTSDEKEEASVLIRKGVIVRNLLLPGNVMNSKEIVKYLYNTYGDSITLSLMSQYTPMPGIEKNYPELGRRVRISEYERLVDFAIKIGVTNAFIQDREVAKDSFIPSFDCEGVENSLSSR